MGNETLSAVESNTKTVLMRTRSTQAENIEISPLMLRDLDQKGPCSRPAHAVNAGDIALMHDSERQHAGCQILDAKLFEYSPTLPNSTTWSLNFCTDTTTTNPLSPASLHMRSLGMCYESLRVA